MRNRFSQMGVTMIEILVVVAIIGIMAAVAFVNINSLSSKLKGAAYNVRSSLMDAKSTAIRNYSSFTVSFTSSTYSGGTLFNASFPTGVSFIPSSGGCSSITFDSMGRGQNCDFRIGAASGTYTIKTNIAGRVWIE